MLPFFYSQLNLFFHNLKKSTVFINCFNSHWSSLDFQCNFGDVWTVSWSDPIGNLKPTACYRIPRTEKVMEMKLMTRLTTSWRIHTIIFLPLLSKVPLSYSWVKQWCFYPVSSEVSPGTFIERMLWIFFFLGRRFVQCWRLTKSRHLETAVHKTQHQHKRFSCSHSQLPRKSRKENQEGLFYLLQMINL